MLELWPWNLLHLIKNISFLDSELPFWCNLFRLSAHKMTKKFKPFLLDRMRPDLRFALFGPGSIWLAGVLAAATTNR